MKRALLFFISIFFCYSAFADVYTVTVNSNGAVVYPSNFWIVGLQTGIFSGGTISNSVIKNSIITNSTLQIDNISNLDSIHSDSFQGQTLYLGDPYTAFPSLTLNASHPGTNLFIMLQDNDSAYSFFIRTTPTVALLQSELPLNINAVVGGTLQGSWTVQGLNLTTAIISNTIARIMLVTNITVLGGNITVSTLTSPLITSSNVVLGPLEGTTSPTLEINSTVGTAGLIVIRNDQEENFRIQSSHGDDNDLTLLQSLSPFILNTSATGSFTGGLWTFNGSHLGNAGGLTNFPTISTLTNVSGKLQLANDSGAPGTNKYYGTDSSGIKGYHKVADYKIIYSGLFTWVGSSSDSSLGVPGLLSTDSVNVTLNNQVSAEKFERAIISGTNVVVYLDSNGTDGDTTLWVTVIRAQ